MNLKKHRKAQVSIEYVAGFLFFLVAILFVLFSVIDKLPQYYEESHNTLIHETAWLASQRAMSFASVSGMFNNYTIPVLSECIIYTAYQPGSDEFVNGWSNYTSLKSFLGIDGRTDFRMSILSFEILVSNESSGVNYTGWFDIDGAMQQFEIFNYTFGRYDGIHIEDSYSRENEFVTISSQEYAVEKIDPSGKFAIISRTYVDCGRHVFRGKTTAAVKRYATYNGSLARMELVLWN